MSLLVKIIIIFYLCAPLTMIFLPVFNNLLSLNIHNACSHIYKSLIMCADYDASAFQYIKEINNQNHIQFLFNVSLKFYTPLVMHHKTKNP